MADFKSAFQRGMDAAEVSERNRKEIDDVFAELNRQLDEVTSGAVEIKRTSYTERQSNPFVLAIDIYGKRDTYRALAAFHKRSNKDRELARWHQDRNGYPCKITLGESELYCEDKEALERALAGLLSDAIVGEILQNLMKHEKDDVAE